jgi:hypothetical protein
MSSILLASILKPSVYIADDIILEVYKELLKQSFVLLVGFTNICTGKNYRLWGFTAFKLRREK